MRGTRKRPSTLLAWTESSIPTSYIAAQLVWQQLNWYATLRETRCPSQAAEGTLRHRPARHARRGWSIQAPALAQRRQSGDAPRSPLDSQLAPLVAHATGVAPQAPPGHLASPPVRPGGQVRIDAVALQCPLVRHSTLLSPSCRSASYSLGRDQADVLRFYAQIECLMPFRYMAANQAGAA
jgi:hypothetical protein